MRTIAAWVGAGALACGIVIGGLAVRIVTAQPSATHLLEFQNNYRH
jgi:hypothetical protein